MSTEEVPRPSIAILPTEVAARIAAGEVVERPASAVKELVENALDAGAQRVDILLEGGGLDRIRVADDGCGIPADQLDLAFARHGTSKLRSDADLGRLATLGFRGEALHSIAAVADVAIHTRAIGERVGTLLRLRGGRIVARELQARQPGTTVTVDDLFGEVPARRKFLRTRAAEGSFATQVAGHLALARPNVAVRLVADGREVFRTAGVGELRAAALTIRGPGFARGAAQLGPAELRGADGRVLGTIHGLLGPAGEQRSIRSGLSIFVNGRWVQNRAITHAVEEAYETVVRTGRFPVAVIFLDLPTDSVDVNVHPAKSEVRLLRERELYAAVRAAVLAAMPVGQHLWGDEPGDDEQGELAFEAEELRVLGQAGGTYIVAEGALGLYLVDQHAAHERVLLEQLHAAAEGRLEQQMLLVPDVVELPSDGLDPGEIAQALAALGFAAEPFGASSVLLRAVPGALAERQPLGTLEHVLTQLTGQRSADWKKQLSVELACRAAVKSGDVLAENEMLQLVRSLGEARLGETCAHGRPTSILLSHTQLARQFGRI